MNKKERDFTKKVWKYYRKEGRHALPWRKTKNPYRILVSEIMLQQTQVERVIPKYRSFLRRFPTVAALSKASLRDVLEEWQGLGYNRRAKMLHEAAKDIISQYGGRFPKTYTELLTLKGVGPYTAGAVMAFAYNKPVPIIETNIRTVFIHHFYTDDVDVSDREILKYVERLLNRNEPRMWYYALMDYGAHLKRMHGNLNVRSLHYIKQGAFKNSNRQIRGAILRALVGSNMTRTRLHKELRFNPERIDVQLQKLQEEKLISKTRRMFSLPA
jgi:A/G-specific adenine glycosylase